MRIYLDNAATSWPKPEGVAKAVAHYLRDVGAPAGRSAYREAVDVAALVGATRARVARLLDTRDANRVVFTAGGTDALNTAIHGVLRPGDHVVTTVCEHNSVLRPLRFWKEAHGVDVTYVACDREGRVATVAVQSALRPTTRLVAVIHASNVTGTLQPVAPIGSLLAGHKALLLIDAAQSLGHIPLSIRETGADLVAAPAHKGLLGPLGLGILYAGPATDGLLRSFRQGGTGSRSHDDLQPDPLPDRLEAGNLNVPGIVGLAAGLALIEDRGVDAVRRHGVALTEQLLTGLSAIERVRVVGPPTADQRANVVSLELADCDPHEVAATLDATYQVQVRAGLHCAPRMHRALGTFEAGGTVRFSHGPFTTPEEIDRAVVAVDQIAAAYAAR